MDKLLMFAFRDLEDQYSGITRKVLAQYKVLSKEYDVVLIGRKKNNILIRNNDMVIEYSSNRFNRFFNVVKYTIDYVKNNKIKYCYIRRLPCNHLLINMLKTFKENGVEKIIWEIPTYPYDFENTSLNGKIKLYIDKIYRKDLKKYISRILTFSKEEEIFGIPTITTGNGIDVDSISPRKIDNHSDEIHLIAAAVLRDWHGYDRLIKGLGNYNGKRNVIFHLIGDGPCLDEYKQLAKELSIENKIIFYGRKNKEEIDDIYDKCDMAVESLGWHRSKVNMGTSIKTREYLAKGMPILASTAMDIFPDGWEYAFYAPIDESPIDIEGLISFYDELLRGKTKEGLAEEIRAIAYEKCDMINMMKPAIEHFNNK